MTNFQFSILSMFIFFAVMANTSAVEFTLPGGVHGPEKGPGGFVDNFYRFSLLISGILAFGAIVYGGIKYVFAAGNPSGQSEGKEWVKSALLGLLLLGGAYLILQTINPRLVSLDLATLPTLAPAPAPAPTQALNPCSGIRTCGGGDGTCSGYCPLAEDGRTQVCRLVGGTSQRQCVPSSAGVRCGAQPDGSNVNGSCPSGQICSNRGNSLINPDWRCIVPQTATCGTPPNHYGPCPPIAPGSSLCGSCVNIGGNTLETARYTCRGSRPCE